MVLSVATCSRASLHESAPPGSESSLVGSSTSPIATECHLMLPPHAAYTQRHGDSSENRGRGYQHSQPYGSPSMATLPNVAEPNLPPAPAPSVKRLTSAPGSGRR